MHGKRRGSESVRELSTVCSQSILKMSVSGSYWGTLTYYGLSSVSHSSTEADIISLDAGLRMDGILALTLWDLVIEVFHAVPIKNEQPKEKLPGNPLQATKPNMHNLIQF